MNFYRKPTLKTYNFKLAGSMYSTGPIYAWSEQRARALIRAWLDVARLPNGTEVYQTKGA